MQRCASVTKWELSFSPIVNVKQDPYKLEEYRQHCTFLPDINNEGRIKRKSYARNLATLERLVLFRFSEDNTVVPRDSAWFSEYNGTYLIAMRVSACGAVLLCLSQRGRRAPTEYQGRLCSGPLGVQIVVLPLVTAG
jgi:Palmitoyl protein thioesterase